MRIENRMMNADVMKKRTRAFALRIIRLVEALPKSKSADVIGKQLLRCGTSVGANYRASCRARSQADFIAKMGIVEEEADETVYWIELLVESGRVEMDRVSNLLDEANQLVAIFVSSIKTARENKQ
jgi:four helix bundle protein